MWLNIVKQHAFRIKLVDIENENIKWKERHKNVKTIRGSNTGINISKFSNLLIHSLSQRHVFTFAATCKSVQRIAQKVHHFTLSC